MCSVTSQLTSPSTQSTPYTNGTISFIGFFDGLPTEKRSQHTPLYCRITLSLITFCSLESQLTTSRSFSSYSSLSPLSLTSLDVAAFGCVSS